MNSKEIFKRTIEFKHPSRVARTLPAEYGRDITGIYMNPSVDQRPNGPGVHTDEWGAVWNNIGICRLGEVTSPPLDDWGKFDSLHIPDVEADFRWKSLPEQAATIDPEKFCIAWGVSIYERTHFIRGMENVWTDIYLEPEKLVKLIDILVDMNLKAIRKYQEFKPDGYMFCDDWGLQNKLMISPDKWREIWKPAYTRIYTAAHEAGMKTLLHSCGYIVDILDDLIEAGLDVIQMDQQQNMGLDLLSQRFAGRITFWCPVDIQNAMCRGSLAEIRAYVHEMFGKLATRDGGFIAGYYGDSAGAGHSPEAIQAMCEEFLKLKYPLKKTPPHF